MSFLCGQHGTAVHTTTSPPYPLSTLVLLWPRTRCAEVQVTQWVTATKTSIIVGKVMMNGQGESAGRFSQESEATVKKYNASGPEGLCCEFNLHNLWKKNPVLYVPALPSVGRQTASALRGGRGEVQVTGTSQAPCRDSEPQQPGSLLQPSCW